MEIFFGAGFVGGLRVPTGEEVNVFSSPLRVILRRASIAAVIVGIALKKFVRSLETLCRIFLKEFLKENYDRLWNIFESFKR